MPPARMTRIDGFTCFLCPRRCGVDRAAGRRGFCGAGDRLEIYRYGPHHGEEPPISAARGSGTVFFSRCTLSCLYCQNYPWSQQGRGEIYTVAEFAEALADLARRGCHNWNLVSPTPWLPFIRESLAIAADAGFRLPVVYNTSGYEREEIIDGLGDLVDVYLSDLRYSSATAAAEGSGCADYAQTARRAFRRMWRQKGPLRTNSEGAAVGGTICRLLILPGRAREAVENLRWLADNIGAEVAVSVMAQYTPAHRAARGDCGEDWGRRITLEEYEKVCSAVEELGFLEGWIQDFEETSPANLLGYQMQPGRET